MKKKQEMTLERKWRIDSEEFQIKNKKKEGKLQPEAGKNQKKR